MSIKIIVKITLAIFLFETRLNIRNVIYHIHIAKKDHIIETNHHRNTTRNINCHHDRDANIANNNHIAK